MSTSKDQVKKVFVVEDDPIYRRMVQYIMSLNPDYDVHIFETGKECIEQLKQRPHLVSLDYSLPDMNGGEVLQKIKQFDDRIEVIMLSGQQDIGIAIKLLKLGAFDYVTKDHDTQERLINVLNHFNNQINLKAEVDTLRAELETKYKVDKSIIGASAAMQPVFTLINKAIQSDITVSIHGETGTGKEVVAKAIHMNSARKKAPFIAVNMSAIPSDLLESELFGYEKGAFTGAQTRKKGQFELANKGTLFLDEIADISLPHQAKILRAIQEREVMRVGGETPIPFDARIIIATHKDIQTLVLEGAFREDLYYRLIGLSMKLPPLRERNNDILLLAQFFLKEIASKLKQPTKQINSAAKKKLLAYHYPGNVRELRAIIELAAVLTDDQTINEDHIQFQTIRRKKDFIEDDLTLEEYKRKIIHDYLRRYGNDVLLVAKKLNIGKSTIYRLLKDNSEPSQIAS